MVKPLAGMSMTVMWTLALTAAVAAAPPVGPGIAFGVGQAADTPRSVHALLNEAIASYRQGDYEKAARLLYQAQLNQGELSADETADLNKHMRLNSQALKERRTGADQVRTAETALQMGRLNEAAALLRTINANQYLAPADKTQAQQFTARLRSAQATSSQPGATAKPAAAKADAKALLGSARAALQRGDLDGADRLTAEAEKAAAAHSGLPGWLHPWSDTPAKVRKDIQAARAKLAAQAAKAPPAGRDPKAQDPVKVVQNSPAAEKTPQAGAVKPASSSPFQSIKNLFAKNPTPAPADAGKPKMEGRVSAEAGKPKQEGSAAADAGKPEPAATVSVTRKEPVAESAIAAKATAAARAMLKQGRQALQAGNLAQARQDAEKARDLKPDLNWWEDTPQKLLADVSRVESAKAGKAKTDAAVNDLARAGKATGKTAAAPTAALKADADPRALLKLARAEFAKGRLDQAEKMGQQAAAKGARWGLFEDTPEKLHIDIQKARTRRDREESVRLLAEARKLYGKGQFKEAKTLAFRAQKLHGPYSIWELGDRPQKLINEIETAEFNNRKSRLPVLPPIAVVKNTTPEPKPSPAADGGPKAPAEDPRAVQAREWLAEARVQLRKGNTQVAAHYAEKVEKLNEGWDPRVGGLQPWCDDLAALRRDLRQGSGSGVVTASNNVVVEAGGRTDSAPQPVNQELTRQQARMLLAEAKLLQGQGRLVEARQKAVDAQKTGAAFGPDEERPEMVLLQLGALCDKKIASLLQRAGDCLALAGSDPAQLQKAEADLLQARELSAGFGLDSMPVENKFAALRQTRAALAARGLVPPERPDAGVVKVAAAQPPVGARTEQSANREQGLALLDKARLELRSGQTAQARRLAAEAFKSSYGVQPEAEKVLRSIDVEEFNQEVLVTNHSFDAADAAYRRRDFAHSAHILGAIDVRKLSPDRAARLRELMLAPEMQPTALAMKGSSPTGVQQVSDTGEQGQPLPSGPVPVGRANANDQGPTAAGDDRMLANAAGMQEVKFQQLHEQSRQAQRDAMARFRAGDTDRALAILLDFKASLADAELDEAKMAQLSRPIDDRLKKLRTLKYQRDFEREQLANGKNFNDMMRKKHKMEQQKHEQVAQLMKQYHALFKEGKYANAELVAEKAHELDPENVAADAAVQIARLHKRETEYKRIGKERENYALEALNDTDKTGPSVVDNPIYFDKETAARSKKRFNPSQGIWGSKGAKELEIERKLSAPISLNFKNTPLAQVIDDLRDMSNVNIVPDIAALNEAGIGLDRPLDLQVTNLSLRSALNVLLQQIHLTYVIKDEVLQITTEENARGKLKRVTYPVADLVVPVDNHTRPNSSNINYYLNQKVENGNPFGYSPPSMTPYTGSFSMAGGTAVSAPSTGLPGATPGNQPVPYVTTKAPGQTIEDLLIKLITSTIAPQSWSDVGGPGTIQYFPLGLALVINQTQDLQEQIADLLAALRRLQDLEVSLELRLISVSESFYERIGLDFNINIVNKNHRFDANLQTTQFQPFGFIDKFTPERFVSGLTPAGTFTPDLNIPIQQNSFGLTAPAFGNFPGAVPDGGVSLGLAFLSDIQVFMFMEAAQGDRRFNIMQAPKLTMFNGQSATLDINDFQFFLTNITPAFTASGQLYFIPANQPVPLGINITLNPVISADRRFVRVNINATMSNLANSTVPLIPITVPIPQVFEAGVVAPNQDRLYQIYLQQPTFTTISVMTTVSVPDGGTVLLGGLKTLSEARNEYGPPILSKIPYISRLFKNIGYGRDAQSLLMMITPRIIINEEEEIRQTGGPGGVPEAAPQ
jgi:type II secretory pathway component GspD/PulD (secretin)